MSKCLVTLHFDRNDICNCIEYGNDVIVHDFLSDDQFESFGSGVYDVSIDFCPLGKSAEELYTYAAKGSPKLNKVISSKKVINCKLFFCSDICVAFKNYMDKDEDSIYWLNDDSSFTITHCRDYTIPMFVNPLGKNINEIKKICLSLTDVEDE